MTPVPGSSFFREGAEVESLVRFVFCKTDDVLLEAARRLRTLPSRTGAPADRPLEPATRSGLQR